MMRAVVCASLLAAVVGPAFAGEGLIAIDGDTIRAGEERIRILGLDTPETYQAQCFEEARLGYQAAGRLQHLLNVRAIRIARSTRKDKYGRTLAIVRAGKEDVASILIAEGLARPYNGGKRQPWCAKGGSVRQSAY
jgi:micrococcal nuclease